MWCGNGIRWGLATAGLVAVVLCGVLASSAAAVHPCGRVYWRSLRDGDQRCPGTHSMISDWRWTHLGGPLGALVRREAADWPFTGPVIRLTSEIASRSFSRE